MLTLKKAAQKALEVLEYNNPSGWAATIDSLKQALSAVPETACGNMVGPVGWIVSPYGHFLHNPDFHIELPQQSIEWSIPIFLGQRIDNK